VISHFPSSLKGYFLEQLRRIIFWLRDLIIDTAFHITVSGGSRKINRKRAQVLRSEHKGAFDEAGLHVKK
jgi:hypothetical protein